MRGLVIHPLHHRLRNWTTTGTQRRTRATAVPTGYRQVTQSSRTGSGAGPLAFGHDFNFVGHGVLGADGVGGGAGDFAVGGDVIDALDAGYRDGAAGVGVAVGVRVAFVGGGEVVV